MMNKPTIADAALNIGNRRLRYSGGARGVVEIEGLREAAFDVAGEMLEPAALGTRERDTRAGGSCYEGGEYRSRRLLLRGGAKGSLAVGVVDEADVDLDEVGGGEGDDEEDDEYAGHSGHFYSISSSYSACVPIQNQMIPSSLPSPCRAPCN